MNYLAGEAYIGVSKKVYVRIFLAYLGSHLRSLDATRGAQRKWKQKQSIQIKSLKSN